MVMSNTKKKVGLKKDQQHYSRYQKQRIRNNQTERIILKQIKKKEPSKI